MITLKEFMEIVSYRISEGNEFGWQCFGPYAYMLDSWNGDNHKGHSLSIVFDTRSQVVYQVEVHDYKNECAYRYTNPAHKSAHDEEERQKGAIDYEYKMVELEVINDWVEKATAIVNGVEYDNRIQVPLTLPDNEMFELMKMAHERDITLNQMVEQVLKVAIEKDNHVGN